MSWRRRAGDRLAYFLARGVGLLLVLLPERLGYGLCGFAGRTYFRVSKRRQQLALRFLRHAYGDARTEAELTRFGRVATGNLFKVLLDSLRLARLMRSGRVLERVDVSEWRQRMPPPPAINVTAHLGSWEVGATALAAMGHQVHAVGKAARNPHIDRWIIETRRAAGFHIHPRRGGIRTVTKVLRDGHYCALVIDQNQRLRPVIAPFFGVPVRCERSAATLALRLGLPVTVSACLRVGPGMRFRIRNLEAVRFVPTDDPEADLVAAVTRLNQLIEQLILEAPEQYLWIHDRFRRGASAVEEPAGTATEERPAAGV